MIPVPSSLGKVIGAQTRFHVVVDDLSAVLGDACIVSLRHRRRSLAYCARGRDYSALCASPLWGRPSGVQRRCFASACDSGRPAFALRARSARQKSLHANVCIRRISGLLVRSQLFESNKILARQALTGNELSH